MLKEPFLFIFRKRTQKHHWFIVFSNRIHFGVGFLDTWNFKTLKLPTGEVAFVPFPGDANKKPGDLSFGTLPEKDGISNQTGCLHQLQIGIRWDALLAQHFRESHGFAVRVCWKVTLQMSRNQETHLQICIGYALIWYDMIYDIWYMIYDIWYMICFFCKNIWEQFWSCHLAWSFCPNLQGWSGIRSSHPDNFSNKFLLQGPLQSSYHPWMAWLNSSMLMSNSSPVCKNPSTRTMLSGWRTTWASMLAFNQPTTRTCFQCVLIT